VTTLYNRIAGQSLDRLAGLSDGVFAIAMTLLVLDIRLPPHEGIHSDAALWNVLIDLGPRFLMWLMSFLTLGIFWVGQQTQLDHMQHSDRDFGWLHLGFLAAATAIPFSTTLLAEFITLRTALIVYWANILLLGTMLYASLSYACNAKLLKPDLTEATARAMQKRILIAQALYAVGAALCYFGNLWSIAFIVLVQLYYVIAPGQRQTAAADPTEPPATD
jgi:uncharacterized membrane protein